MKIIEGRKGVSLADPLRILSLLRVESDRQRAPALQALADLGHHVVYVEDILSAGEYRLLADKLNFDVALLWGNSLQNLLMTADGPFVFDDIGLPYVSLWTDNPIKHLFLLKDVMGPLHRGFFIADSRVIAQMRGLGFENLFYLPPWHIDPDIFRPVEADPAYGCEVGFAATLYGLEAERRKWRTFWDFRMNAAADRVVSKLGESRWHVDVFDELSTDWDVWGLPFSLISHALYFEQKAVIRELLFAALDGRPLDVVGTGSHVPDAPHVRVHAGVAWSEVSKIFCSAAINLNLTPWPATCHHRVFQAAASGAFMISDDRADTHDLFEPGAEIVTFKSLDELPELIDRYLAHPGEAKAIAAAARRRFLAHHTAERRMTELIAVLKDIL